MSDQGTDFKETLMRVQAKMKQHDNGDATNKNELFDLQKIGKGPLPPPDGAMPNMRKGVLPGIKMPGWRNEQRAMPNPITRSALFSPVKRGKRAMYNNERLPSRKDVEIYYTGPRLDMADSDVFLSLIHFFRLKKIEIDTKVHFKRDDLLKMIGKPTGGSQYEWLYLSIQRLLSATVAIVTNKKRIGFHLINEYEYDADVGDWYVKLSPKIVEIFKDSQFSLIELQKRISLEIPLSKWLQSYIAGHKKGEHRIALDYLKEWSGSMGRMRDWRLTFESAMVELQRQEVVAEWEITNGSNGEVQARWVR